MAESERLDLTVNAGVREKMDALAGGPRRKGEWLSKLVETIYADREATGGALGSMSEAGILERIEHKLDRLLALMESK